MTEEGSPCALGFQEEKGSEDEDDEDEKDKKISCLDAPSKESAKEGSR